MSTKELLKPRWKVIADYPGNPAIVGSILKMRNDYQYEVNSKLFIMPEGYPAIFKKLEWWEEREQEDLPEYVKLVVFPHYPDTAINTIIKVYHHTGNGELLTKRLDRYSTQHCQPSTKKEYDKQQLSKAN